MKTSRILGVIALILAAITLVPGIIGANLSDGGTGKLSEALVNAQITETAMDARSKAASKTAPSAIKKAATALSAAEKAVTDVENAYELLTELTAGADIGQTGDELIDSLFVAGGEADKIAATLVLDKCKTYASDALSAVNNAESKLKSAQEGIISVYDAFSLEHGITPVNATADTPCETVQACIVRVDTLRVRAAELLALAEDAVRFADQSQIDAEQAVAKDSMPLSDRALLLITRQHIGVVFTSALLFIIAAVLFFFTERFQRAWNRHPVFSTAIALFAILAFQVYALGFNFPTVSAWLSNWITNALNVLRSNSSVGMIALGMTLVIITGGIDLAVGSTLAGVATVVMVILDISANGFFTGAGITGLPNYLIAIFAGLVAGVGIGALIGLGVTKGRVPPFIITLGVMEIVRSVAQYFTKSYKTEVPKAFQVLANAEIGGQMLLPILYWLILAVIVYVISKHTAFGRHIYAVGSNERTSRLSGINVNRVKMKVYMLMGFIVAIAAITQVARLRGVDVASAGSGYEMNAIAAVVVGGTSMSGGRGSIIGTMLGVLIIGIMNNLLVLLGIDAFLADAFTGAIIIAAVLMQRKDQ